MSTPSSIKLCVTPAITSLTRRSSCSGTMISSWAFRTTFSLTLQNFFYQKQGVYILFWSHPPGPSPLVVPFFKCISRFTRITARTSKKFAVAEIWPLKWAIGSLKGSNNSTTLYFLLVTNYLREAPKLFQYLMKKLGKKSWNGKLKKINKISSGFSLCVHFTFFPQVVK